MIRIDESLESRLRKELPNRPTQPVAEKPPAVIKLPHVRYIEEGKDPDARMIEFDLETRELDHLSMWGESRVYATRNDLINTQIGVKDLLLGVEKNLHTLLSRVSEEERDGVIEAWVGFNFGSWNALPDNLKLEHSRTRIVDDLKRRITACEAEHFAWKKGQGGKDQLRALLRMQAERALFEGKGEVKESLDPDFKRALRERAAKLFAHDELGPNSYFCWWADMDRLGMSGGEEERYRTAPGRRTGMTADQLRRLFADYPEEFEDSTSESEDLETFEKWKKEAGIANRVATLVNPTVRAFRELWGLMRGGGMGSTNFIILPPEVIALINSENTLAMRRLLTKFVNGVDEANVGDLPELIHHYEMSQGSEVLYPSKKR